MLHDPTDIRVAIDDEGENVIFFVEFKKQLLCPWTDSIVVKLMGKSVDFFTLKRRLESLWPAMQGAQMVDLQNNYYAIKFRDKKAAQDVLAGGPWRVLGHYLHVQP